MASIQSRQDDVEDRLAGAPKRASNAAWSTGPRSVQRPGDRAEKPGRVVFVILEGDPDERSLVDGLPLRENGGLAVAGRSDEQRNRHLGRGHEGGRQPVAWDEPRAARFSPPPGCRGTAPHCPCWIFLIVHGPDVAGPSRRCYPQTQTRLPGLPRLGGRSVELVQSKPETLARLPAEQLHPEYGEQRENEDDDGPVRGC